MIANKLGDDLSFASRQVIRGFTSIFGPLLDTIQGPPPKNIEGNEGAMHNFRRAILRDGINAIGKGAKAGATIITVPARVAGTGLEEARKVGQASIPNSGIESRMGAIPHSASGTQAINDGTKIASTLLNTTSSELSQANLGAVLVEVALKNRIKDIGNRTSTFVQSARGQNTQSTIAEENPSNHVEIKKREEEVTTKSPVDGFLEQFNAAVKKNDERLFEALKSIIAQINPPKN